MINHKDHLLISFLGGDSSESSIFFSNKKKIGIVPIVVCKTATVKIALKFLSFEKSVAYGPNIFPQLLKSYINAKMVAWYFSGKRSTFILTKNALVQPILIIFLHKVIVNEVIKKIWMNTFSVNDLKPKNSPAELQMRDAKRKPVFLDISVLIKKPTFMKIYLK